jgi:hypothetical protein
MQSGGAAFAAAVGTTASAAHAADRSAAAAASASADLELLAIMKETGLTQQKLDESGMRHSQFLDVAGHQPPPPPPPPCTGVNAAALRLLPHDLVRLMCAALRRGMKMLGDSAVWGIVMEAPSSRQVLPRSLPPPPPDAEVVLQRALLPPHLVQPAAGGSSPSHATFRSVIARVLCAGVFGSCTPASCPAALIVCSPLPFKRAVDKAAPKPIEGAGLASPTVRPVLAPPQH